MLVHVILATTLLGAQPAFAGSEHWRATSNTATAITGDVTLRATELVFADGKSLPIKKLKKISFTDDIGKTMLATLYRVTEFADPVLAQGNHICGGGNTVMPVTFVVILYTQPVMPGEGFGRAFAAYSGPAAPSANGLCGIYRYDVVK